ncbi:MAG: hypothetical protein E6K13_03180 [Methanobacteriota archaeon]|nr:MAG: hypothetical protein E6K13_03180 [Euryarchaeota archaeon]
MAPNGKIWRLLTPWRGPAKPHKLGGPSPPRRERMEPMIRCPRDDTELRGRIVAGTIFPFRIDECTKCGGTWFDRGELRKVTHDAELEKILRDYATPGPNPIACLRDQAPMNRRVIEDVEIDVCETCGGFWVDGGELQELVSARFADPLRRSSIPRPASANRGRLDWGGGMGVLPRAYREFPR